MNLVHGSTDVLEATVLVEACRSVATADLVFDLCNNQGAAKALRHHKLVHR